MDFENNEIEIGKQWLMRESGGGKTKENAVKARQLTFNAGKAIEQGDDISEKWKKWHNNSNFYMKRIYPATVK